MADPLTLATSALTAIQKLNEASKKIRNAELRMQIADLMSMIVDLKMECARLTEENDSLRAELDEAGRRDSNRTRVTIGDDQLCYLSDPSPDQTKGPYCPTCYSQNQSLSPLVEQARHFATAFGKYKCPICKTHHKVE